jgi:hypothetical protein
MSENVIFYIKRNKDKARQKKPGIAGSLHKWSQHCKAQLYKAQFNKVQHNKTQFNKSQLKNA